MKKRYTLSILTENNVGLTQRIVTVFTRRKINIDSFSASETENKDIYRFTIMLEIEEDRVQKVANAVEQIIDVFKVIVYKDEDLVYQELALYKVPTKALLEGSQIEHIVRTNSARILYVGKDYTIIEKTGHKEDTQALFEELKSYGIMAFSRSGRIAVSNKRMDEVNKYITSKLKVEPATFS